MHDAARIGSHYYLGLTAQDGCLFALANVGR